METSLSRRPVSSLVTGANKLISRRVYSKPSSKCGDGFEGLLEAGSWFSQLDPPSLLLVLVHKFPLEFSHNCITLADH